ncbi:MAG TPA: hypothetical protein VF627_02950 [Abditibacterium sp.]
MRIPWKSKWKTAVVLTVGLSLGGGVVFAQKPESPTNQRQFDGAAARLSAAEINAVGHAFDNGAAKLFWFTDLERAKAQAQREGKPILSLRLLGNLTDEYSCANSRFFRIIFYPQAQINPLLREKFVLHWESERPVPIVTIDMGDGRQIKRTLTGNSVHYLLDSSGRPLDVMPGVVTPARFAAWLDKGAQLNADFASTSLEKRDDFLSNWHRAQMTDAWHEINPNQGKNDAWVEKQVAQSVEFNPLEKPAPARIDARMAAPIFASKSAAEAPVLDAMRLFGSGERVGPVGFRWMLGSSRAGTPTQQVLDDATRALIKTMNPPLDESAPVSSRNSFTQSVSLQPRQNAPARTPFDGLISQFESSIRIDDRTSLERFQIPIHASFVAGKANDFEALNRKIYDRLFLTPKSDPWLGLAADGVFTGLQNGGIFDAKKDSAE